MKVNCRFDTETRSLELIPENNLEAVLMEDIAQRAAKGSALKLNSTLDTLDIHYLLSINGEK